jgi:hypothetical protein
MVDSDLINECSRLCPDARSHTDFNCDALQGSDPHLQILTNHSFQVFPIINVQKLRVILREGHLKCLLRLGTFAAGFFIYSDQGNSALIGSP